MKLKPGVKVVTGGKGYKGEIPDNILPKEVNKKKIEKTTVVKAEKKEKKVKD